MSQTINPIGSETEKPPLMDGDNPISTTNNPFLSTDSQQLTEAIESLSFKIFSWLLSNHNKSRGKRKEIKSNPVKPVGDISEEGNEFNKNETKAKELALDQLCPIESPPNEAASPLEKLRRKGFRDLLEKIKGKEGYPWDEIFQLKPTTLIEQLVDLYDILKLKEGQLQPREQDSILQFALELAKGRGLDTSLTLGKLIYLVNNRPQEMIPRIDGKPNEEAIKWIDQAFDKDLKAIDSRLLDLNKSHTRTDLQNKTIAKKIRLPIELARLLISDSGRVNAGIISILLDAFLHNPHKPINFEINLAYTLRMLQVSPNLREKLSRISEPNSPFASANIVIQTTLGLPSITRVTKVDSIKTALVALLSHLRQGSDGSCFATPLAIELLSSQLDRCVDDFTTLLESSKLTRTVNDLPRDFPYLLHMGEKNLNKSIILTRKGLLVQKENNEVYIWEAPGIIAACNAIGITKPSPIFEEILGNYFKEHNIDQETIQITVKELLQLLVEYALNLDSSKRLGLKILYLRGRFAFQSQECNPLLQVWENAIAGMAEADNGSMVRSAVIDSLMKTLKNKIKELLPKDISLRKQLYRCLKNEFTKRIHLQYDPVVPNNEISSDQQSTEGAFVLYDQSNTPLPSRWFRVDNPKAFQAFILRIIAEVKQELIQDRYKLNENERETLNQTVGRLSNYVETTEFILTCLRRYYPQNRKISDPIVDYGKIKYAPWITKSGNNLSKVIQVYMESKQKSRKERFFPIDSEDLLIRIIEMAKSFSLDEKNDYKDNPNKLIPIRITGIHAFSLMLGHPTLSQAWSQENGTDAWIAENVVIPGKKISKTTIEKETRDKLIQYICDEILQKDKITAFLERTSSFPSKLSIKAFRKRLLHEILEQGSTSALSTSQLSLLLDTHLYKCLPPKQKTRLEDSAVHFADTNWADGIRDIHFCFTINPGNGKLEIWASTGNGKNMLALSQNQWIKDKKWEFFTKLN